MLWRECRYRLRELKAVSEFFCHDVGGVHRPLSTVWVVRYCLDLEISSVSFPELWMKRSYHLGLPGIGYGYVEAGEESE